MDWIRSEVRHPVRMQDLLRDDAKTILAPEKTECTGRRGVSAFEHVAASPLRRPAVQIRRLGSARRLRLDYSPYAGLGAWRPLHPEARLVGFACFPPDSSATDRRRL